MRARESHPPPSGRRPARPCHGLAALSLLLLAGCFPKSASLEGRACDPEGACVEGYVCERTSWRCLAPGTGSAELCDGLDNDLDGLTDEDLLEETLFQDSDRDGFGARDAPPTPGCLGRPGWAQQAGDCVDTDPEIHPGAVDTVGDAIDQNCDDLDGVDADGDRHASQASGGDDCLDTEITCIADCTTDFDGDGPDCADFCVDADKDGYGVTGGALGASCLGLDCDDRFATCTDTCVDLDDDLIPDCGDPCVDLDGDGWGRAGTDQSGCVRAGDDCDDALDNLSDGDRDNLCDPVDRCQAVADAGNLDSDGDCPPSPFAVDPACGDACDVCTDVDGDGYPRLGTGSTGCAKTPWDCDDTLAAIHPGATEACDGLDQDCDGLIDDGLMSQDSDHDGLCDARDSCWNFFDPSGEDSDGSCPAAPFVTDPACGDACSDGDGDGVMDTVDLCPTVWDQPQTDTDGVAVLLHANDFEDPAQLSEFTTSGGGWSIAGGTLEQSGGPPVTAVHATLLPPTARRVSLAMKPGSAGAFSVYVERSSDQDFLRVVYDWQGNVSGNDVAVRIERSVSGALEVLASRHIRNRSLWVNNWRKLQVVTSADRVWTGLDLLGNGALRFVLGAVAAHQSPILGLGAEGMAGLAIDDLELRTTPTPDGRGDACDVCPDLLEPGSDCDGDGVGDLCEPVPPPDADGDGIADACDLCQAVPDPRQEAGRSCLAPPPFTSDPACGLACSDTDLDGVVDQVDNCPETPNPGQEDTDAPGSTRDTLSNGYPTRWLFLGPWKTSGGCDNRPRIPSVISALPSVGEPGWGRRWFVAESTSGVYNWQSTGVFGPWSSVLGGLDNIHGFAAIWFDLPAAGTVRLSFGTDDGARLWIDTTMIYQTARGCYPRVADLEQVDLALAAGWHRLLLQVTDGGGSWGHQLRFLASDGTPLVLATSVQAPGGDGVGDACDRCPRVFDPRQIDRDGDGLGDACDPCGGLPDGSMADSNGDCPAPPYLQDPWCGDACSQP